MAPHHSALQKAKTIQPGGVKAKSHSVGKPGAADELRKERFAARSKLVIGQPFRPKELFHQVTVVPNALRRYKGLSAGEKLAWQTIASFLHFYPTCYARLEFLATEMGTNARQAKRWLDGLAKNGFLRATRRPPCKERSQWETTIYEMLWHEIFAADDLGTTTTQGSDKLSSPLRTDCHHPPDELSDEKIQSKKIVDLKGDYLVSVSVSQPANSQSDSRLGVVLTMPSPGPAQDPALGSPLRKLIETALDQSILDNRWVKFNDELREIAPNFTDNQIAEQFALPLKYAPKPPRSLKWFKNTLSMKLQEQRERTIPPSAAAPSMTEDEIDSLAAAF